MIEISANVKRKERLSLLIRTTDAIIGSYVTVSVRRQVISWETYRMGILVPSRYELD